MTPTNREILFILNMRNMARAAIAQFGQGMKAAAVAANQAAQSTDKVTKSASQAATAMGQMAQQAKTAGQAAQQAFRGGGGSANGIKSQADSARGALQTLVAAAISFAGLDVMGRFQQQMANFKAVTNSSAEDMGKVEAAARQMGSTTQYTANQVAEALTIFAKAGFDASTAIAASQATLNLATVGQMELSDAAQTTMNVMNQFSLSADKVTTIVDILAKTDNMAALSVGDLASSFSYAGTIAAQAGVSVNTLSAAFGVLGDAGTRGSRAGTEMQQVISRMLAPTPMAVTQLKALGLTLNDLDSTNLVATFKKLHNAGMTTGQAIKIFGEEGGRAAVLLTNAGAKFTEFEESTKKAGGTAQRAADITGDTFVGSIKKLGSALTEMAISLGEAGILPGLTAAAGLALAATTEFNGLLHTISAIPGAVAGLSAAVAGLVTGLGALFLSIKAAEVAMAALNLVMRANPFVLILTAVIALAAAIYSLRDVTFQWGDATVSIGSTVQAVFEAIWGYVKAGAAVVMSFLSSLTSGLSAYISAHSESIQSVVGAVTTAIKFMVNLWIGYGFAVKDVFAGLAKSVIAIFGTMLRGLGGQIAGVGDALSKVMRGDISGAKDALNDALSKDVLGDMGAEAAIQFGKVKDAIRQDLTTDYVQQFVDGSLQFFRELENGSIKSIEDIRKRAQELEKLKTLMIGQQGGDTSLPNAKQPGAKIDPDAEQSSRRQEQSLQRFNKQLLDNIQRLRDEANVLGMTTDERERYTAQMAAERAARDAGIADVKAATTAYVQQYDAIQKIKEAYQANPLFGLQAGFQQFADEGAKLADNVADAWKSALGSISDNIVNLVTGAKASWGDMLKNFGAQMLKAGLNNALSNLFKSAGLDKFMGTATGKGLPSVSTITAPTATVNAGTVNVNGAGLAPLNGIGPTATITSSPLPDVASIAPQSINAGSVASTMATFFKAAGMTNPLGLAAIMGNAMAESGMNPFAKGDGGNALGLFQWNDRREKMLGAIGGRGNLGDIMGQMKFAHSEMTGGGINGVWDKLLKARSLTEANDAMLQFERPQGWQMGVSGTGHNWKGRYAYAQDALNTYGGVDVAQAKRASQQVTQIQQQGYQAQIQQAQQASQQVAQAQQSGQLQQVATAQQSAQQTSSDYQALAGSVSQAGQAAQTAAPAIASTGQNVQTVGAAAPQASSGVGMFGQGISAILGPLSQAIPGLGQFSGMIMQVLNAVLSGGSGGGGGILGGLFGGLFGSGHTGATIGSSSAAIRNVAPSVFANAQRYHGGGKLGPGEVPFIGLEGERVLNPRETKEYEAGRIASPGSPSGGGIARNGGGTTHIQMGDIKVNVESKGSSGDRQKDQQNNQDMGKQVAKAVDQHMTEWVTNQHRPGGFFASGSK
ncbi:phage tail tape measure protein [Labrys sp. ZIDIC5]|uniref:phage tail tape measure protein n=1 Tax=Labrys sedimenti TaxID=3106036 RepID=UPI002ACA73BD|nr:phage tail tape measure protein [Labrys sp. ZIDIC5]MDZ5448259.1 phage tail tape measure protein [Labrys sp. ZIDIC5]